MLTAKQRVNVLYEYYKTDYAIPKPTPEDNFKWGYTRYGAVDIVGIITSRWSGAIFQNEKLLEMGIFFTQTWNPNYSINTPHQFIPLPPYSLVHTMYSLHRFDLVMKPVADDYILTEVIINDKSLRFMKRNSIWKSGWDDGLVLEPTG
jgi:hypothetical protein